MLLGIKPVVSLWNPNNTPLVMGTDASQIMKFGFPPFALRWKKYRAAGSPSEYESNYVNLNYAISNESTGDGRARSLGPYIMQLQFARDTPIVFQPGEVKMFTIPIDESNFLESGGNSIFGNDRNVTYQAQPFLPDGFYVTAKTSVQSTGLDSVHFPNSSGTFQNYRGWRLTFGDGDRFDIEVVPEARSPISLAVSGANEVRGSGFQFWMSDADYATNANTPHFRNYQFISRFGGANLAGPFEFNADLMLSGLPGGAAIPYEGQTNALPGSEIKEATENGEAKGLLLFTMMSGAEVHSTHSPGAGAGRRITTRPFLHGSTLSTPQISDNTRGALYDYGWEWQVEKINDVEEAFQDDGDSRGYYGGGYTVGAGVTHVVQQYLPALPPISIAALSSARLGGFSLADAPVMATKSEDVIVGSPGSTGTLRDAPNSGDFRQVTATGQGGLAPHTLQAVGNSYAHPNIPADRAFTTYTQLLNTDTDTANPPQRAYADHSYLANEELALKGALQAALDDEDVSINAAFRTPERSLDSGETDGMATAFTKALEGPIAYGSTPYVDQADVLRHMGSILTPRGDTFMIRTYGDSLDAQGNVVARAWCEAIVQRTPEYLDSADKAHLKNSELVSEANKQQGRRFQIMAFRWLNADEI